MFNYLKQLICGTTDNQQTSADKVELTTNLTDNLAIFKEIFANDDTITYRHFETAGSKKVAGCLIFVDGMVDKEIINDNILLPLMNKEFNLKSGSDTKAKQLIDQIVTSDTITQTADIDQLVGSALYGDTILLLDGLAAGLTLNTKGWKTRSITEPTAELVAKGPRAGFVESILVNVSLIRRRIKSPNLKFEFKDIGSESQTKVCISYIEGIANPKIVQEVIKRLNRIEIDGLVGSNQIEELIKDSPLSPFRTVGFTEKPDKMAANLLDGRVVLLVDGTPVNLTMPFIFMEYFQSPDDYYANYIFATINRFLRYLSFFLSTSIPAIYVSLVTYHQEMIPTPLLVAITASRTAVPFPTIVEVVLLSLIYEILRESGLRLPEPVGGAVSIVGALVLGEAAVQARFVSSPVVIVVALTGISSFINYKMNNILVTVRLVFLLLATVLGLYGYILGVIGLIIHLVSLRSFGIPYMLHLSSFDPQELKDTAIRAPWWYMYTRPKLIAQENRVRKSNIEPQKGRE
ncbi:MAG: spore germination protein [Bacillota bacterium]